MTVSTDVASLINSEFIETAITTYGKENMVVTPFFQYKSLVGSPTATASFPREVKSGSPLTAIATEATALVPVAKTFTDTTIGVSRYGIARTISKTAEEDNVLGETIYDQTFIMDAANLYIELWDTNACALFASASSSVGVTATDLTVNTVVLAKAAQDVKLVNGKQVIVLHKHGLRQLRTNQLATTSTAWQSFYTPNADDTNYGGTMMGCDIWATTLVAPANANADRMGCIFAVGSAAGGSDAYAAFAHVMKRTPTAATDADIMVDRRRFASFTRTGHGVKAADFATGILHKNA